MFFFFLSSGILLGWSLGANDAANVFGTAVGTRMIRFRTAAIVCSVFVLLGAVLGGAGASHTLGKLGAVNALPGSFTVALAAGLTVTWMTRLKLPVSTSQAIVGAIIGWNFFCGVVTDSASLTKILSSWVICPILAALFGFGLFHLSRSALARVHLHLFTLDGLTRYGLLIVGAFAAYSLGANNIANVMGVFVPAAPFEQLNLFGLYTLSPAQQLFLLGAIAIGVGVITYSKKVMMTVGDDLFRLSPIAALIVVLAQALVLFLFSSEALESWLLARGLPTIPLVPVSSSQAVIGAVIGIGIAKGGRNIRWRVLGRIASGWVSTPIISCGISFVFLFFVQNVFDQKVFAPMPHELTVAAAVKLKSLDLYDEQLDDLINQRQPNGLTMRSALRDRLSDTAPIDRMLPHLELQDLVVNIEKLEPFWDHSWYTEEQLLAVFRLHGKRYRHRWQLQEDLGRFSDQWKMRESTKQNRIYNRELRAKLDYLVAVFEQPPPQTRRD